MRGTIASVDASRTRTTVVVDTPTYRRLVDLARTSERSISAELRIALKRHLESSETRRLPESVRGGVAGRDAEALDGARTGLRPVPPSATASTEQADEGPAD